VWLKLVDVLEAGFQMHQPRVVQTMPHATGRRSVIGFAAVGLLVTCALQRQFVNFTAGYAAGPPAPLASAQSSDLLFVVPVSTGELGLLQRSCGRAESPITRYAGGAAKPGGKPAGDEEAPKVRFKKVKLRPGEETERMQYNRVSKRAKWLKSLKGKFVPVGPKPWEKHRFTKVVIQVRLKAKQAANTKIINQVVEELRRITGMHPRIVKAKHDVANFGWRKGAICGSCVSLFGPKMYDFLERLNTIILPRVRDFDGLIPNSFDGRGNFWMGFENQDAFRELDELTDTRELVHGFDLGIVNSCETQPDGLALMKAYGFPFGNRRQRKAPKVKKSFVQMRPY